MRDRRLLYATAFRRALATGMAGMLVGIYLAKLGFDPAETGRVIGAGLGGAALAALVVRLAGDRLGRRRTLMALSLLAAAGGVAVAAASGIAVIAAAAFLGMLNGMGRDRGASLIIDQAILPATAADGERTVTFAWYNVLQDAGHALGGLLAAAPAVLRGAFGLGDVVALRLTFAGYAAVFLAMAGVYAGLWKAVEAERVEGPRPHISPESRRVLWRILAVRSGQLGRRVSHHRPGRVLLL